MDTEILLPATQIKEVALPASLRGMETNIRHGTTTLAFVFQGGIVIAVDSKATAGAFVASRSVNKVIEINQYLLGTMAGGAADCFYWEKDLGVFAKEYELETGRRLSAQHASKYLVDIMYRYRGYGLSLGTMICGYSASGPEIYNVTNDGLRIKHHVFSVGSGSTIAKGILSQRYSHDMSKEEALQLGKDAIYAAGMRDAASGGTVNLYFMNQDGWKKIGTWEMDAVRAEKEQTS